LAGEKGTVSARADRFIRRRRKKGSTNGKVDRIYGNESNDYGPCGKRKELRNRGEKGGGWRSKRPDKVPKRIVFGDASTKKNKEGGGRMKNEVAPSLRKLAYLLFCPMELRKENWRS